LRGARGLSHTPSYKQVQESLNFQGGTKLPPRLAPHIAGHGKPGPTARPDPARKWPGPPGQNMLSGRAWAGFSGPIDMSGRVWDGKNRDLLKARPDGLTARRISCLTGRAWARKCGLTAGPGRAGPGQWKIESGFLSARPDPARPKIMPRYSSTQP
jgi:hypothetical protein